MSAFATAGALIVLAVGAMPWPSLPGWMQTLPPLAFFVLVGVLFDVDGRSTSSLAPLALLPVLWLAWYGTRGQLLGGILGAVAFAVPRRTSNLECDAPHRDTLARPARRLPYSATRSEGPTSDGE